MRITSKPRKQFKSYQKRFEVDPEIVSKVNKIIKKDDNREVEKKYVQHKEAQRKILDALNDIRLEYLQKHRIIVTSSQKVIQAIQQMQDQLQDHLDLNKQTQLDKIQPDIEKFMKQRKYLKKIIISGQSLDIKNYIDGTQLAKNINLLKPQTQKFNSQISLFTDLMTDILKNLTFQKKNKQKKNKMQEKYIQTQQLQPKQIPEFNKKILRPYTQQSQIVNKNKMQEVLINQQIDLPINYVGKTFKTDKLLQKQYSHQLILQNFDIVKQKKLDQGSNNQQIQGFKEKAKESFNKLNEHFAEQSSIMIYPISTPTNIRELQSVRSENSFATNNTRRSGSYRPVNCLEVLRKQKIKYDQLKNHLK